MDTTIRDLDATLYHRLENRAAVAGRTVGEMINEALRVYLSRPERPAKGRSLSELVPEDYPPGNENLSQEIDAIVYGV